MSFLNKLQAKYLAEGAPEKKLSGLSVNLWGELHKVGAEHWGNAASPIYYWSGEEWVVTQYQVASFRHNPKEALKQLIYDSAGVYIDEQIEEEVEEALKRAKRF